MSNIKINRREIKNILKEYRKDFDKFSKFPLNALNLSIQDEIEMKVIDFERLIEDWRRIFAFTQFEIELKQFLNLLAELTTKDLKTINLATQCQLIIQKINILIVLTDDESNFKV